MTQHDMCRLGLDTYAVGHFAVVDGYTLLQWMDTLATLANYSSQLGCMQHRFVPDTITGCDSHLV